MHLRQRDRRSWHRRWIESRRSLTIIAVLVCITLTACGGSDDDTTDQRRFATDPYDPTLEADTSPTELPTLAAVEPTATEAAAIVASPASIPKATVTTVYTIANGNVSATNVLTGVNSVIDRSSSSRSIMRVSSSLDGDEVAVLARSNAQGASSYELTIRTTTGKVVAKWENIQDVLGEDASAGSGRLVLDWSNSADRIAVAFPSGGAIMAVPGKAPTILLTPSQAPAPTELRWAPNGDVIAFVSHDVNGQDSNLSVATTNAFPVDPVRISGAGGERPILALVWQLDGSALYAIQADPSRQGQVGGDVIRISRRTLRPRFETGENLFSQVAQIVAVAPSPDGETVGYVVVEPKNDGGWEASVWLVGSEHPVQRRIQLGPDPPVADFAWTVAGLTITLIEPAGVQLVTVNASGDPVASSATPITASPVSASPIAALPLTSPLASPVGTP